jgi:hypothetical protein
MMDDTNPHSASPVPAEAPEQGSAATETPQQPVAAPATAPVSDAVIKFRSCRWRCDPDQGEFCTHRDVLPFAGKEGFTPDSWCPDCSFYKLRRQPKKREYPPRY